MDVNKLFNSAIGELEKMINSKSAVGEPITIGDTTIIPLTSIGFGFGAGGGSGNAPDGSGTGGATAGGGGVRPVAILVKDKNGVRVETLNTANSLVSKVADTITEVVRSNNAAKRIEAETAKTAPKVVTQQGDAKRIAVDKTPEE